MPYKPKHPCACPGCPNLTAGKYCEQHQERGLLDRREYDRSRRSTDVNKKYGRAWRKIRARYVALHPLCEQCLKEGRYVAVEEVHHVVPVNRGGSNAFSNLMSLCHSCHEKMEIAIGNR